MLNMKNSASNVIENGAKVPQQLFEAKDKISALESAQRALKMRLVDALKTLLAARVGN